MKVMGELRSVAEKTIDVFVGDFRERAFEFGVFAALIQGSLFHSFEDFLEFPTGLLDPQTHQREAGTLVENDHQDPALSHNGDVEVVLLAFMEEEAEFLLSNEFGQAIRRCNIACR